ncbi:MAG: hypothetical protein WBC82_07825 [Dehalococcoidia bacterium]
MKGSQKIGMAITPLIVLSVMTIGYGFLMGGMIKEGDYLWAAIVGGAGVLGAGIIIFASGKPEVHRIRTKIANVEPVIVNDYRLVYASEKGKAGAKSVMATSKVSGVIVKVTNHDAYPHRVAVDVDINDKPVYRAIRKVAINPGATTYVAMRLPRKLPLEDIELLSIRLKQTS